MRCLYKTLCTGCFLLLGFLNLNAQHLVKDLLTGKDLVYETKYVELNDIDINYPIIKGLKDTLIQNKLNARFKQIFVDHIESDSFRLSLFGEVNNNMEVYNSLQQHDPSNRNGYEQTEENYIPPHKIEDIEVAFLSYLNSTLTMMQVISYRVKDRSSDVDEEFYSCRLFYFNVLNGKEYKPTDIFKKSSEKQINHLIEKKVKEKLNQVDFKELRAALLDLDEEEGVEVEFYKGVKNALSFKNRGLENFSVLKEGFAFPKAFSMAYYIPAWSKCTQNIFGMSMEVRLTFDEIRTILNPNGPFASLISFRLSNETQLKNQNQPTNKNPYNEPEFDWIENVPLKISNNLKKITVKQHNKSFNKADTTKREIYKEIYFDKNGNLTEISELQGTLNTLFTYDNAGRIIKKTKYQKGKTLESFEFLYDEKGNVIELTRITKDQYVESTYYHYEKNRVLEESYNFSNFYEEVNENFVLKTCNELGLVNQKCYLSISNGNGGSTYENEYDKNNRLILSYCSSNKEQPDYVYYVYDERGNLTAKDFDKGSRLIECHYDNSNNLIRHTRYENRNISITKTAAYDENKRIISFEEKQNNYNPRYYSFSYEIW